MGWYSNLSETEKARRYDEDVTAKRFIGKMVGIGVLALIALCLFIMFAGPYYSVWRAEMSGKAELSNAEYAKQALVETAKANLEAEELNAQAEVARAEGAAEARKAEGLDMTPEQYTQYLWVQKLSLADTSVIYIPTDGGLPVLTQSVSQ